jgi:hypothetical protein
MNAIMPCIEKPVGQRIPLRYSAGSIGNGWVSVMEILPSARILTEDTVDTVTVTVFDVVV